MYNEGNVLLSFKNLLSFLEFLYFFRYYIGCLKKFQLQSEITAIK